ncbi:MAG: pyruvate kinase [Verrucomicrobiae bacterium]|nr:pyruvate kinase [Verrucomicrobiae bacterium]
MKRQKTKIIATIGPACESPEIIARMIEAGMDIARLNFSHGDFVGHSRRIMALREAERITGKRIAILADLPGPKIRLGVFRDDAVELRAGDRFTLTTHQVEGTRERVTVCFGPLPKVVRPGCRIFLNDGLVELEVERAYDTEVECRVIVGGELRSRKGLNIPGVELGVGAFTDHDRACLEFAVQHGVDAVGQSFVGRGDDLDAVRAAVPEGYPAPFVIAKIERATALQRLDEILRSADGIMVARGDLGVEVPIEEIAIVQKKLIAKANLAGKPVITATQMLESMVNNRLPTRAEATDVANAVLDGTDCLMLSAESAMGKYPVEAVRMLARIAAFAEAHRPTGSLQGLHDMCHEQPSMSQAESIALVVEHALETVKCAAVFVPTRTGTTARMISRFKPAVWIVALSRDRKVCQSLHFSAGVVPVHLETEPGDWAGFVKRWLKENSVAGDLAMLVTGPSEQHPDANHRLEFVRV